MRLDTASAMSSASKHSSCLAALSPDRLDLQGVRHTLFKLIPANVVPHATWIASNKRSKQRAGSHGRPRSVHSHEQGCERVSFYKHFMPKLVHSLGSFSRRVRKGKCEWQPGIQPSYARISSICIGSICVVLNMIICAHTDLLLSLYRHWCEAANWISQQ